jgi:hypothetical protein
VITSYQAADNSNVVEFGRIREQVLRLNYNAAAGRNWREIMRDQLPATLNLATPIPVIRG